MWGKRLPSHPSVLVSFLWVQWILSGVAGNVKVPIGIDCGSDVATTDPESGEAYDSDDYFLGGEKFSIPIGDSNLANKNGTEIFTLRAFASDQTPCYKVPVADGKYLIHLNFWYNNYDNLNSSPSFNVVVGGITLGRFNDSGESAPLTLDFVVHATTGLPICLQSIRGTPFINAFQIIPEDETSFGGCGLEATDFLRSVYLVNSGGPEISDLEYRTWSADESSGDLILTPRSYGFTANVEINDTDKAPEFLPQVLFWSLRSASGTQELAGYNISSHAISPANKWLIRFHFAELYPRIIIGERLLDVLVSATDRNYSKIVATNFDIYTKSGLYNATSACGLVSFPGDTSSASFNAKVVASNQSQLPAIYSGGDFYEVISGAKPDLAWVNGLVNTTKSATGSQLSGADIFGILVAIVVLVLLGLALYFFCVRRKLSAGPSTADGEQDAKSEGGGFLSFFRKSGNSTVDGVELPGKYQRYSVGGFVEET